MKSGIKIMVVFMTLFFVAPAFAGTGDPGVNKRQHRQQKRIAQGVRSGELTGREAVRLEREQARIARKEARFKSDGELTRRERAILHRDLNRSNRHIYGQKHDDQSR